MDDRRQVLNAAGVAAIPQVTDSFPPSPPAPPSGVIITFRPELVEAARQCNLALGRAYMAAGAELCRLFGEMLR